MTGFSILLTRCAVVTQELKTAVARMPAQLDLTVFDDTT
jgi:hypothetical protein